MPRQSLESTLNELVRVCANSASARACSIRVIRFPVLSLRVQLADGSFVDAFTNVANGKVSFALIDEGVRIYGKDNSGGTWHMHPRDCPLRHEPCPPTTFAELLGEVEGLRFGSQRGGSPAAE